MGNPRWIMSACVAGLAYAVIVFAAGFALGAVRIVLLVPILGTTPAVLLEAPVMLALSWWVSSGCILRFTVHRAWRARLLMGAVALLVLQLAEGTLAATLFDQSLRAYLAGFDSLPGAIGLTAQLAFASWPLVQAAAIGTSTHGSQQSSP
jgi:hypothetical protein